MTWLRRIACWIIVMASCCLAPASLAQTADAVFKGRLDAELQAILSDPLKPLASLSALAIRDGRIVYQGHFGARYIDSADARKNLPANDQTLYRVASISKLVTAIGVMRLVEQHKLDLDADISRYLGFALRNPDFPAVAISARMLLSHTSSLRDAGGYSFPLEHSLQSVLDPRGAHYGAGGYWAAASKTVDHTPGRYFAYVNLNWGVLGTLIEAISGQRFDYYMKEAVLAPLHISGDFNPESLSVQQIANLAVLYRKQSNEVWNPSGPWVAQVDDFRGLQPAPRPGSADYRPGHNATPWSPQGGLRIGADGLARLMLLLLNGGELDAVRLLSQQTVDAMLTEQWRYDKTRNNGDDDQGLFKAWALGVQKFLDSGAPGHGDRLVAAGDFTGWGHLGFAYGLQSGLVFDPVRRNGMVYIIGGVGSDPERDHGAYSSLNSWQEKVLDALYRHAIAETP